MGWFDEQIKQRKANDSELLTESYIGIAGAVMGRKLSAALRSERLQAKSAIDEILRFYHIKPREIPDTIREITDCRMAVGQVAQEREGEKLILTAQVELQILAVGEDGENASFQHTVSVPCPLELPDGCQCLCRCEGVGDTYASPAAGGVEVRFTLDFRYCAVSRRQITFLSGLHPGEANGDAGEQPSLVLRMLEAGERLWDVAKAYGTTIGDIVSANELEDESAGVGKLLLIPRKR